MVDLYYFWFYKFKSFLSEYEYLLSDNYKINLVQRNLKQNFVNKFLDLCKFIILIKIGQVLSFEIELKFHLTLQ